MATALTGAPVLVTGATGYVAGWIVKALLQAGAVVHAPVRDPDDVAKRRHLDALSAAAPGTIRYFRADLLKPGSYAPAMQRCGIVFHTASPFATRVADPQTDLIDPAVKGTRNVLEQAARTDSVRRVVLTSSCAAMYTDAADCAAAPGGRLTEEIWNTTASLTYQPYSLSKTLAEQEAWRIAGTQNRWRLVAINPSLVMGPAVGGAPTSESFRIMRGIGAGNFRFGAPRLGIGIVDVRDVAAAHVAAAVRPEASGRNIVSGHDTDLFTALATLRQAYGGDHAIPPRALPKWLIWLAAPAVGLDRRFVRRNVDIPWRADTGKARRDLGVDYRPLQSTMQDMFAQMIDAGATGR